MSKSMKKTLISILKKSYEHFYLLLCQKLFYENLLKEQKLSERNVRKSQTYVNILSIE